MYFFRLPGGVHPTSHAFLFSIASDSFTRWFVRMTQCCLSKNTIFPNWKPGFQCRERKRKLVGGNSNMFYFHPENWGRFPFWRIFFRWVGSTTNQKGLVEKKHAQWKNIWKELESTNFLTWDLFGEYFDLVGFIWIHQKWRIITIYGIIIYGISDCGKKSCVYRDNMDLLPLWIRHLCSPPYFGVGFQRIICKGECLQNQTWNRYNFRVVESWCCWWKKSCTSWYDKYPIIYRVLYIPGGVGFLPSTVLSWCPNFPMRLSYPLQILQDGPLRSL